VKKCSRVDDKKLCERRVISSMLEVGTALEQAVLECFRAVQSGEKNEVKAEVDEDLTVEAVKVGDDKIDIKMRGCLIG
jgi:hypothetical protein